MMSSEAHIAELLLQIKAIKLSPQMPFTWASGIQSPIYCDNRMVLSYPNERREFVNGFVAMAQEFSAVNAIAGVATAGIPHGMLLADRLNLPFIYVRSSPKSHGTKSSIEGYYEKNQKVLVVEDLISTGGSSLQAVEILQENGLDVQAVLAIFTYGFQRAVSAFAAAQIPLRTLSNYFVLLDLALEKKYITEEQLSLLKEWNQAPETWKPI
jgi:orotate phosphoribosyltransferase